jgi:transposase
LVHTRHDLTDEQWALIEGLLPDRAPVRGGRWMDHRQVIDGVMWRTRSGSPWRDLPGCYGNWKTVYNRHRRWSGDGTWSRVLGKLRADCDHADGGEWALSVDATVVRAHHHSAGARHEPPRDIPAAVLAPTVLGVALRPVAGTGGTIE